MRNIFKDLHWRLGLFTLAHSFLAESSDYCMTVVNVPEKILKDFIVQAVNHQYHVTVTEFQLSWLWATLAAAPTFGALLGAGLLGILSAKFGRRDTIMVWSNLILIMSSALQLLSAPLLSYEILILGRFLAGVCVGVCWLVPVYLAECSPDSCRGLVSSSSSVGRCLWDLLGPIFGLPELLGTKELWPYLLALPALPGIVHLVLTPIFPKSPKFLYMSQKDYSGALEAVKFYHGDDVDIPEILAEYEREARLAEESASSGTTPSLKSILLTPHLCWPLVICVVCGVTADLGGVDITSQYSTELLEKAGMTGNDAAIGTIITMAPPLLLSTIAPFLIEHMGRRKIVFVGISCGILAISLLFVASFVHLQWLRNTFSLGGVAMSYIGTYVGMGTVPVFLPGELAPEGSRSITASIAAFSSWFPSAVILLIFPPVNRAIGSFSYLPFIVLSCGSLVFLCMFMPETKNRPVDEIVQRWVVSDKDRKNLDDAMNEHTPLINHRSSLRV